MKIKELIVQTPEMTEEKLLEIMDNEIINLKRIKRHLIDKINQIYRYSEPINKLILKEFDLIQDKKSYLTKSERDIILGFVGACAIKMVKDNGGTNDGGTSIESSSEN